MENYCGSEFWNTDLTWNTEDPELTRCFENTVLVWVPCVFLWIFSSLEVYYILSSKRHHIPWSWLNITKLLVTAIILVICISDLITSISAQSTNSKPVYNVIIYTPIWKMLTFGLSFILVYYNKKHGLQVSGVQFIFWLLLAICGSFQFRSEIRNAQNDTLEFYSLYISYLIFYPLVVFMFILNCFADKPPVLSSTDNKELERLCPEENSGFPSRLLFSWFDSFAWKGFRNPLELGDLWKIRTDDSAKEVTSIVDHHWQNTLIKTGSSLSGKASYKPNSDGINLTNSSSNDCQASILPALIKTFGWSFLFGCFLKLLDDTLIFASPQLLRLLINYVEFEEETWKGYLYAVLLFAFASIQTVCVCQYYNEMFIIGMRVRTALVSMIYRKALRMSTIARKESTVGEIVNLMAVDAQRFVDFVPFACLIWSAPLQIIVALYFLWKLLGPSVMAGVAVMVLIFPLTGFVAERMQSLMLKHMNGKDERVKLINEVLNGMKILKLYAWEPSFENQISKIRNREVDILRQLAYVNAAAMFIWTFAPFMIILVTFAVYVLVDESHVLDAQTAFVSISLFNILKFPLSMLPYMVSNFAQILVSIKRINKFLNSDELDSTYITNKDEDDPIIIEKGTFSWGEEPVLRNINLRLKANSLTAVVGTVGCGKSSLICSVLGEMQKIEGHVNIFGSIGYVSQQAWIQNATLKDNILFGNPLDETLYRRVIKACALKPDIEMLPGGDQTEIGEKGINLSGGQKQRVNLARAVYSNCDIYFLDDPLSAVDSHVGKHIFEQLIGPNGLLKDKTRVLVTHGITYLPYTDKIVVLKNGEISEMGSYNELLERKGAFSEFILNHISEKVDATDEELEELNEHLSGTAVSEEVKQKFQRLRSRVSESVSETGADGAGERSQERERVARQRSSISTETPKVDNIGEKLIEEEKSEIGNVKWAVYKHYLKSIGLFLTIVTLFFDFIFQGFSIGTNVWLSVWATNVNDTVGNPKQRDMYLGVYGALGIGQAISSVFAGLAPALGCCFASKILHQSLLKSILRAPMSFFDTTPLGRILSRFSKDIDVVDTQLPWLVYNTAFSFFEVIGTIVVISFTTPIFMTVVLPIGVLYYLAQQFYIGTSRQLKRLESVTRSPIYSHFSETLTGVQMIRAFGAQDRFINEANQKVDKNQICYFPSIIADRWLAVRLEIVGNLIIFFSTLFLVISKERNAGLVGLSVTYALQITQTLNWLVRQVAAMETDIVAVERIKEYSETEPEAPWEIANKKPPSLWPEAGNLQFKRYSLRYRPGLDLVLKGVSVSIKGGEKIGIVGRTGAGKSSLTLGLFRLIEAAEGEILIDGVNISQLGLHDLRSKLTIIPQDAVLFSGSLRLNLDPFDKYSDAELWRALEYAHLKDFIKGLSADLQHEITEGGESLSVGQRQLVCLSRALLRKTKVLILDEATAAVDLETDDLIQRTIRTEFKDCTVLTIAHRINTIMDSNRVIVLDKGEIVEFDDPISLLKNSQSIFYDMCKSAGIV